MAKKRGNGNQKKDRHTRPRESFHLDRDLKAALERCAREADPPSDKTGVITSALKAYLIQRGYYKPPPSAE